MSGVTGVGGDNFCRNYTSDSSAVDDRKGNDSHPVMRNLGDSGNDQAPPPRQTVPQWQHHR